MQLTDWHRIWAKYGEEAETEQEEAEKSGGQAATEEGSCSKGSRRRRPPIRGKFCIISSSPTFCTAFWSVVQLAISSRSFGQRIFTSFGLRISISLRIIRFESCSLKTVTWIGPSSGMTGLLGCPAETTFLGLSELPKEVLGGVSLASNDACNETLIAQNSKSSRKFRRARAKGSS